MKKAIIGAITCVIGIIVVLAIVFLGSGNHNSYLPAPNASPAPAITTSSGTTSPEEKEQSSASTPAATPTPAPTPAPTPDTESPVISDIVVSDITATSVSISWVTDETATSQVEYGTSVSYDSTTTLDEELITSHSVLLSGLEADATYHYCVKSKDSSGNEALSDDFTFTTLKEATEVGGIMSNDTTWTEADSPYIITSTVQIPVGVTLTIEPGVTVSMPSSGNMFLLHGIILAHGTTNNKIVFDGGGNSDIIETFWGAGHYDLESGKANLEYCIIRNGYKFWDGGGYFSLVRSELTNLTQNSGNPMSRACIGLDSPVTDCYIEYNSFVNTGGLWTCQAGGNTCSVFVRYNLFQGTTSPISNSGNDMIVKYNSFVTVDGPILSLRLPFGRGFVDATENYWNTEDTNIIDQMIYDRKDDITVETYVTYSPILTEPHPSTPSPE